MCVRRHDRSVFIQHHNVLGDVGLQMRTECLLRNKLNLTSETFGEVGFKFKKKQPESGTLRRRP